MSCQHQFIRLIVYQRSSKNNPRTDILSSQDSEKNGTLINGRSGARASFSIQDTAKDGRPLDNKRSSFLRNTLYGTLALPRLLLVLNSPHARDDNARAVVLSLRSHGLKQAKGLFQTLYKHDGDDRTELRKSLDALLCSSQPHRLRACEKCRRVFFDRSRLISNQQCDGCRGQTITEERSASRSATKPVVQRKLPSPDELEQLLSLGHDSEPKHTGNDFLVYSCDTCSHRPRTLHLTFWWVQSHNNFWKDLVDDLPVTLQESFNARWRESTRTLTGTRLASLALAWCIREADHWQALADEPLVQEIENWARKLKITTWELLDLTYLPPYNLAFLQKVSKTAHQSSRQRKHASAYWDRGGVTRYAGTVTSQGYWTACAGPLAVCIRPHAKGKSWDEKPAVPRTVWREIVKLWRLRYPERQLPSTEALRRRVVQAFSI